MAVEALVLGGDERLPDREGDLVEREHGATLETELADQAAIGGEDLRRLHLHVVAGPDETRDAGAMLAGADAGPGAVGEPQQIRRGEHRRRHQPGAGLGMLPPGDGARQGNGRGDRSHGVTT